MPEPGLKSDTVLLAWAEIVLEKWIDSIVLNRVHDGDKDSEKVLYNSINRMMLDAGNDGDKIEFLIPLYGIFVDMGVGREISIGNSGNLSKEYGEGFKVKRKAKPWYSSVWFKQIYILSKEIGKALGEDAANIITFRLEAANTQYRAGSNTAQQRKIKTKN